MCQCGWRKNRKNIKYNFWCNKNYTLPNTGPLASTVTIINAKQAMLKIEAFSSLDKSLRRQSGSVRHVDTETI